MINRIRGGTVSQLLSYNASSADPGSMPLADIWDMLQSSPEGLTQHQVAAHLAQYGPNSLQAPPGKSMLSLIAEQFQDRLVQILLGVAVLSGVFSYMEMSHF
jgi:magnesium-transporting ATPase (P-type)